MQIRQIQKHCDSCGYQLKTFNICGVTINACPNCTNPKFTKYGREKIKRNKRIVKKEFELKSNLQEKE